MTDLLAALLLGIIEGITEFLPISSTGHLLIAERWLGHRSDLFNISIQAGAILAVVLIYRQRLWDLAMGFLGRGASAAHDPAGIARSLGLEAIRITNPAELKPTLSSAFNRPGTKLIEVVVDGSV